MTAVSASLQKIKSIKNQHKKKKSPFFYFIKSQTSDSFVTHFDGHFAYLKTMDFFFKSRDESFISLVALLLAGLFRYAIMQSGSPLAYWAMLHPPASTAASTEQFVRNLGCVTTFNMAAVKACLKKLSWKAINNATYMVSVISRALRRC